MPKRLEILFEAIIRVPRIVAALRDEIGPVTASQRQEQT